MMVRFLLVAMLALFAGHAGAQSLSTQQKNTLKAAILAEPALAQAVSIRNDSAIADFCNSAATPTQKAWKTTYTATDLFSATDLNVYIARSVAERQAYDLLITIGAVDPSSVSIRSGIANIFSGAAAAVVTQRAAILNDMTRSATWAEKVLGGTNATTDTVTAWRLNFSGAITPMHISELLNAGN